jgi:hypothetical protein
MLKLLLVVLLAALCPSCSSVSDLLEETSIPRDAPDRVVAATTAAFATPDVNGNGRVDGLDEWEAFVRSFAAGMKQ